MGRKRKGNEDALFLDDDLKLYVVADGMGGHQAGEVASELVIETMQSYMTRFRAGYDVDEPADSNGAFSKEANRLLAGIYLANKRVHQVSNSKDSYRGMGSTVSAVFFSGNTLFAANVGDSPVYLVHAGSIELLSVPHTVLAEQAALSPDSAKNLGNSFKHMLTRAMGIEPTVTADICEIQCFKGDTLIICSDGLSDKLSSEEILDVTNNKNPEKACKILVDLANERGGDDNITVIVLKIKKVYNQNWIMSRLSKLMSLFKSRSRDAGV